MKMLRAGLDTGFVVLTNPPPSQTLEGRADACDSSVRQVTTTIGRAVYPSVSFHAAAARAEYQIHAIQPRGLR